MSQSKRRLNQNDCTITNPVVIRPILSSYVSGIVPLWRCPFGRCVQYLAGYSGPCTRSPTDQQVYLIWQNCRRQQALRLAAMAVDQYFASIALRWVTWLSPITEFWYFISQNWLIIIPKVGVFGWHGCIFLEPVLGRTPDDQYARPLLAIVSGPARRRCYRRCRCSMEKNLPLSSKIISIEGQIKNAIAPSPWLFRDRCFFLSWCHRLSSGSVKP